CLLVLLPAAGSVVGICVLSAGWGIAILGFSLSLQSKGLHHASDVTVVAMSLFSVIFIVGIGAAALLGSMVSQQLGLANIGVVGGVLAVVGLVLCGVTMLRFGNAARAVPA